MPAASPRGPQFTGIPFQLQLAFSPGLGMRFQIERQVIADEQVEVAVPVVVDKSTARAPQRPVLQQARIGGDIREGAVTIVAVEHILAE